MAVNRGLSESQVARSYHSGINDLMEKFGDKVRERMKTKGFKQTTLAERLGTRQGQISRWVNGRVIELPFLIDLAEALEVSIDYLVRDDINDPISAVGLSAGEHKLLMMIRRMGEAEANSRLMLLKAAYEVTELSEAEVNVRRAKSAPNRKPSKPKSRRKGSA